MAKPPVSEQVQVNFRMPVDLRNRIKYYAELNNRSMNAEIISALEEAIPPMPVDERFVKLNKLISKYLKEPKSLTDDEERELNTLIVDIRLDKE